TSRRSPGMSRGNRRRRRACSRSLSLSLDRLGPGRDGPGLYIQTVCVYHTDSMHVNYEGGVRGERATRTLKADQSEATRAALIEAARELFAARGYAAVPTEEIVRAAGVTRGALYHHFAGKRQRFEAVYEAAERRLVEQLAASALASAHEPRPAPHAATHAARPPHA